MEKKKNVETTNKLHVKLVLRTLLHIHNNKIIFILSLYWVRDCRLQFCCSAKIIIGHHHFENV